MGLLHSMEQTLLDRRVWVGALDMLPAPAFLSLMLVLVPLQPRMHTKVGLSPAFTRVRQPLQVHRGKTPEP